MLNLARHLSYAEITPVPCKLHLDELESDPCVCACSE